MRSRSCVALATSCACLFSFVSFTSIDAAGAPTAEKLACAAAYNDSQTLRIAGRLLDAREKLLFCAQSACPVVVRGDCSQWLGEVEKALPSAVVEVHRADGSLATEGVVLVDGARVAARLDGRAIDVDPGEHVVRVELVDGHALERHVLFVEGGKLTVVRFELERPPVAAPNGDLAAHATNVAVTTSRPVPWTVYPLAGIGGAALASWAYFGLSGLSQRRTLDRCYGGCDPADVSVMKRDFLVADVSMGVALIAIGAASWLFIGRPEVRETTSSSSPTFTAGAVADRDRWQLTLQGTF